MNWYANRNSNDTQGLIVNGDTGENIAVSYKAEHASLIASAPEAIDLLKETLNTLDNMTIEEFALGRDKFIKRKIEALLYKFDLFA
jgi:hypothetical protein